MKMKFLLIALGLSVMNTSAWSASYTVFPGSKMPLTNIQGSLSGGTSGEIIYSTYSTPRAAAGGITRSSNSAACVPATTINGFTGQQAIVGQDIIIGISGTSTGAITNIGSSEAEVRNRTYLYTIDGTWDAYGKLSSTTASSHSIGYNCLYPKNAPSSGYIYYGGPNQSGIGTRAATLDLSIWAYIGPNVPYGTYTPHNVYFVQGISIATQELVAYRQLMIASDRIIVAPPPCSIGLSKRSINFGTGLSDTISDTLSINCLASNITAQVYVKATAIQGTSTADGYGLGLINAETNESNVDGTGIVVRGTLGQLQSQDCSGGMPDNSILFNPNSMLPGFFVTDLFNTHHSNSIPLDWYLCTTNKTVPGDYSGSVTLGITYR